MKTIILSVPNRDINFNPSVAALAGVARHHGFDCETISIADGDRVDDVVERTLAHEPDVVCATLLTRDVQPFRTLFARLKRHSGAVTAAGGYHATVRPRHVAQWEGVDAVGIGEGERAFLSLLRTVAERGSIVTRPGLWARGADGFADPIPPADPEPDMTALPWWDYSVFGNPMFVDGDAGQQFLATRASRTCPFACHYCTVPIWEKTNGLRDRDFVNVRTVAHLCDELASLRDRYRPHTIDFWDPQFPFATEWLREFAERYASEVGVPFRVLMHPRTLNQERIELLAAAGCAQLYYGIESGDVQFRKTALNKACTDEAIVQATAWVQQAGMKASAFVMWNMPGETREQAEKTIEMVDRVRFDRVRVTAYIPLPGTVMGDASTIEFPDAPVEVFEPLPDWRNDRHKNWSAMSEPDYLAMLEAFTDLQTRYAESGDGTRSGERDAWLADALAEQPASEQRVGGRRPLQ